MREASGLPQNPVGGAEFRLLGQAIAAVVAGQGSAADPGWDTIDRTRLLYLATQYRLVPLLHEYVRATGAPPDRPFEEALSRQRTANLVRNEKLASRLCDALQTLHAGGIQAIPFKGPALAISSYGDMSLRQFDDLDILVRPGSVAAAAQLLFQRGYRPYPPARDPCALRTHPGHGIALTAPDDHILVEIDDGVAGDFFSFRPQPAVLWSGLRDVRLCERDFHGLSVENLLILLCTHGAKHMWTRLAWVSDIAGLLASDVAIRWDTVLDRARDWGAHRMVLIGLQLASNIANLEIPGVVEAAIEGDPRVGPLVNRAMRTMVEQPGRTVPTGKAAAFHLAARERTRDRARYCLRLALTPTNADWKALPLPPGLRRLYYLTRPFRLAASRTRRALAGNRAPR